MNMNVELIEQEIEEIEELVKKEITEYIHDKIISAMRDSCAGGLTQQNIQLVTYRVIGDVVQNLVEASLKMRQNGYFNN